MDRPAKPVELPTCTCTTYDCQIHGALYRRRTFQRVNRWARQGKISPERHQAWIDKWRGDHTRTWKNLNDAASR